MFFNKPGEPTLIKKTIYLIAATILGGELSVLLGTLVLASKYQKNENQDACLVWYSFIALGALCGFLVGRFWWLKLYVEKVWAKK